MGKVESIYDYVRDNVKYQDGPLKAHLAALKDGTGDCEELRRSSLHLPGQSHPSSDRMGPWTLLSRVLFRGQGRQRTLDSVPGPGTRDFGSMPDTLERSCKRETTSACQKRKNKRVRAEFLSVKSIKGAGKPNVRFS